RLLAPFERGRAGRGVLLRLPVHRRARRRPLQPRPRVLETADRLRPRLKEPRAGIRLDWRRMRARAAAGFALWTFAAAVVGETARHVGLRADLVLDGRGGRTTRPGAITVREGHIVSIEPDAKGSPADYDLTGLTILPGLIDLHSHLAWTFNSKGRLHAPDDGENPAATALAQAAN